MAKIDELDLKILTELVKDASISVPKLSKKIAVNQSVAYSRIKRLSKRNLVQRFTVLVNEKLLGYTVDAVIGCNIDSRLRESIVKEIFELDQVRDISEVTGRFDLLVNVKARSLDDLHDVISAKMGKINGVQHTETFIEMKRTRKDPEYKELNSSGTSE
ncbi:MAG: Lrp/AsnC family transcriptional regulator [Thaumarchaeota archaeon]|nr:Lrp/AsnC family transcriptional regulator [Nitrososphaerota archaeon]